MALNYSSFSERFARYRQFVFCLFVHFSKLLIGLSKNEGKGTTKKVYRQIKMFCLSRYVYEYILLILYVFLLSDLIILIESGIIIQRMLWSR